MLPLALDVMGGDNAPSVVIEGARRAKEELGASLILVGTEEVVGPLAAQGFEVEIATEVIEMHDDPASSVRTKRDSSLVRCAELVKEGRASSMISAGNTGATMASALLKMGRLPKVARPAIATVIPVPGSTPTVVIDSGANSEVQPQWLVQFGEMGSVYANELFGIESPRVGILSIGEEKGKGNDLVKEAWGLLAQSPNINFIGNVEGRDVMSSNVDVVVCDGFVGNIVLKTLEGAMKTLAKAIFEALSSGENGSEVVDMALPKLLPLLDELNPDTYGGAILLGVKGICVISHGSSSSTAIYNAIATSMRLAKDGLAEKVAASVTK
ncbi:MAG: phosphate acyltransferase PlsX [Actinomycetota bacterium]|nr:phosphate acyltransferase PlsX [Actinomycetota bacterium]